MRAPTTTETRRRPRRDFFWKWPRDGMAWFMWGRQNYGSRWIVWRVGPFNYNVEVAGPGECSLPSRPTRG